MALPQIHTFNVAHITFNKETSDPKGGKTLVSSETGVGLQVNPHSDICIKSGQALHTVPP